MGVQYDEPVGRNDGKVKGREYFSCAMNYGAFVRPASLKVGDYPERGLDSEASDDSEAEGDEEGGDETAREVGGAADGGSAAESAPVEKE